MLSLQITNRAKEEKLENLRAAGRIPAVFYGKKETSTPISVLATDFIKLYKQAGESSVIKLEGEGVSLEALIKDVDVHPVTNKVRHADFYIFEKGKKIEIDVPIEFVGVAPAVKDLGGTLVKVLYSLEIEAEPKDLPQKIEVDISVLTTFESVIHAGDVKLPSGVKLLAGNLEIVASVAEPKEEVEEVTTAPDLSTIEVVKKGKEEKEGEEAESAGVPAKEDKGAKKEDKGAKK